MEKLIISACFLESGYKYNGKDNKLDCIDKLKEKYELIIVCPEIYGGLTSPRVPAERVGLKVITENGLDVTEDYVKGSLKSLEKITNNNITKALLKAKSPSCGKGEIYDGTFSHKVISGNGVFAEMLIERGIKIYTELEIEELL